MTEVARAILISASGLSAMIALLLRLDGDRVGLLARVLVSGVRRNGNPVTGLRAETGEIPVRLVTRAGRVPVDVPPVVSRSGDLVTGHPERRLRHGGRLQTGRGGEFYRGRLHLEWRRARPRLSERRVRRDVEVVRRIRLEAGDLNRVVSGVRGTDVR